MFEPGSHVVNVPEVMTVARGVFSIRTAVPRPRESGWTYVASSSTISPLSRSARNRFPSKYTVRSRTVTSPLASARPAPAS